MKHNEHYVFSIKEGLVHRCDFAAEVITPPDTYWRARSDTWYYTNANGLRNTVRQDNLPPEIPAWMVLLGLQ